MYRQIWSPDRLNTSTSLDSGRGRGARHASLAAAQRSQQSSRGYRDLLFGFVVFLNGSCDFLNPGSSNGTRDAPWLGSQNLSGAQTPCVFLQYHTFARPCMDLTRGHVFGDKRPEYLVVGLPCTSMHGLTAPDSID